MIGARPALPLTCPPDWADLIERCWDGEPARRPEIARVHEILHAMHPDEMPADDR